MYGLLTRSKQETQGLPGPAVAPIAPSRRAPVYLPDLSDGPHTPSSLLNEVATARQSLLDRDLATVARRASATRGPHHALRPTPSAPSTNTTAASLQSSAIAAQSLGETESSTEALASRIDNLRQRAQRLREAASQAVSATRGAASLGARMSLNMDPPWSTNPPLEDGGAAGIRDSRQRGSAGILASLINDSHVIRRAPAVTRKPPGKPPAPPENASKGCTPTNLHDISKGSKPVVVRSIPASPSPNAMTGQEPSAIKSQSTETPPPSQIAHRPRRPTRPSPPRDNAPPSREIPTYAIPLDADIEAWYSAFDPPPVGASGNELSDEAYWISIRDDQVPTSTSTFLPDVSVSSPHVYVPRTNNDSALTSRGQAVAARLGRQNAARSQSPQPRSNTTPTSRRVEPRPTPPAGPRLATLNPAPPPPRTSSGSATDWLYDSTLQSASLADVLLLLGPTSRTMDLIEYLGDHPTERQRIYEHIGDGGRVVFSFSTGEPETLPRRPATNPASGRSTAREGEWLRALAREIVEYGPLNGQNNPVPANLRPPSRPRIVVTDGIPMSEVRTARARGAGLQSDSPLPRDAAEDSRLGNILHGLAARARDPAPLGNQGTGQSAAPGRSVLTGTTFIHNPNASSAEQIRARLYEIGRRWRRDEMTAVPTAPSGIASSVVGTASESDDDATIDLSVSDVDEPTLEGTGQAPNGALVGTLRDIAQLDREVTGLESHHAVEEPSRKSADDHVEVELIWLPVGRSVGTYAPLRESDDLEAHLWRMGPPITRPEPYVSLLDL